MENQSQHNKTSVEELSNQYVLAKWIKTVSIFHGYYHRLDSLVNDGSLAQPALRADLGLGQCPASALKSLLIRMKRELKCLLQDMNNADQGSSLPDFQRLAAHSSVLDGLNKKAQNLLDLASLSAS